MKAFSLLAGSIILFLTGCLSQKPTYSSEVLQKTQVHRTIAVLPFKVTFTPGFLEDLYLRRKRPVSYDEFAWEHERTAGLELQYAFFKQVTRQVEKGKMKIVCLDILQTNKLLGQQNISMKELYNTPKEIIAQTLGVDAIILGETAINMDRRIVGWGGVDTRVSLYDVKNKSILLSDETNERFNRPMDTPAYLANSTVQTLARRLPY